MAQMTQTRAQLVSVGRLLNEHVIDIEGRDIGRVEDLVLDLSSGDIDFAVVKFGGLFGMGGKYHVIPWQLMNIDDERRAFTMDVTKEQVDRAPAFDSSNVPDVEDTQYMDAVFGYWGVERSSGTGRRSGSYAGQGYGERNEEVYDAQDTSGYPAQGYDERGGDRYGLQDEADYGDRDEYGESGRGRGGFFDRMREGTVGGSQTTGGSESRSGDVSYGDGTRGPERRRGSVHGGGWSGAERRAGW